MDSKNTLEEILKEIFPEEIKGKQRLEIKKIKEYFNELSIETDMSVDNDEQLKQFFLKHKRGRELKELMEECFKGAGINFNGEILNKIYDKTLRWDIFCAVFNIYPLANPSINAELIDNKEQEVIKEAIKEVKILDIKELQKIYDKANKICMEDKLDVCAFDLTETMPITIQDDFYMVINDENLSINTNCVGLVDCNENKVVAVGYLKAIDEKYYLIFDEKNINYNSFEENSSFKVIVFPTEIDLSLENGNITLYEKESSIYYKK